MGLPSIKIAHMLATNFLGGPEKQILEHGLRLRQATGFDFCLISFVEGGRTNDLLDKACQLGLSTHSLYSENSFDPKLITALVRILRSEGCNLLVTHGYKANIIGRFATWALKLPQIAVSRGWTSENFKVRVYENLDKVALQFVEHVIAVSEGQRRNLLSFGLNSKKITVIRNAVEVTPKIQGESDFLLRKELNLSPDILLVIGAGRLSPEKNFRGFIEASRRVIEREPHVAFVIFGEGVLRNHLESQVRSLGLENHVFLPGFHKDFASIIAQADIFFQSSLTEGLPNVVLEAFAAKLPVVATNVGGTAEIVQEGRSGFLVAPEDVEAMANRLTLLLRDQQARVSMGNAGYGFVANQLNFSQQTRHYQMLYEKVVGFQRSIPNEISA